MSETEQPTNIDANDNSSASENTHAEPVTPRRTPRRSWLARYMAWPTLLCLSVIIYLLVFGENSVPNRFIYEQQIDSLQLCVNQLEDSLHYYKDMNRRLSTDPALMEQVVREQYNMKRPNEDVFVVERQEKKK